MRTFAIVNRKGGVGKTTTAVNLAYILATNCKLRVLLVDADSQGNASGILRGHNESGLAAVLRGEEPFYENVIDRTEVPGLDLLPASGELGDLDLECITGAVRPRFDALSELVACLEEDDVYDAVVIDCPPYFSVSCLNAITAAGRLIIPTDTDAYSAVGMAGLVRQIESIRKACPGVRVSGCLVTKWHRADVVADAVNYLRETAPVHVFHTVIRRTDKVTESTWAGEAAAQWSPFCAASRDYRAWVAELMAWEGMVYGQV